MYEKVLMLASGLSAKQFEREKFKDWTIVTCNNGYKVTPDWDFACFSRDFRGEIPKTRGTQRILQEHLVKEVERTFGGQYNTGYSIVLISSYWVLSQMKPKIMSYLGADMNYTPDANGHTCIYGVGWDIKNRGMSDPDLMALNHGGRDENYIGTIYKKFQGEANKRGTYVCNLSDDPKTRLPFPRCGA